MTTTVDINDRAVEMLPIDKISVSKWNPRRIDPEDPQTAALAQSMAGTAGLIQPIAVRPHPAVPGGFELLAGSRRLAAARSLGWKEIPAEVFQVDDATAVGIIVIENLQRKELSPLEEAAGLRVLLERGDDHEAIARSIGWPLSRVARRAQLLKLIPEWTELGKHAFPEWTASHLELIARLPEEQQRSLGISARKDSWSWRECTTVPELEKRLQSEMRLLSSAPWDLDDASITRAGACSSCPKRASERPELFWDESEMPQSLKGHDRCLHGACWSAKLEQYLELRVANLKKQHPKLVLVNAENWSRGMDMPPVQKLIDRHKVPYLGSSSGYARVKKTDPDSLPAVVVLGKGRGTFCYVKKRRESGASGVSKSSASVRTKSLKDKEEQLAAKRWNWVIDELIRRVRKDPSCHFRKHPLPVQRSTVYGILLAMEPSDDMEPMGSDRGARICRHESLFGERLWRRFDEVIGARESSEPEWLRKVWERECIPRITDNVGMCRAGRQGPTKREQQEVARVCELTRVTTPDELQAAAAKQFPEPKAWAQQRQEAKSAKKGKSAKPAKQPGKSKPSRVPDFMRPLTPSAELSVIVGDKPKPRTEITKKLWQYITKHELQDQKNKRMIRPDDHLAKVFGTTKAVSMFDMTKLVSKHLK